MKRMALCPVSPVVVAATVCAFLLYGGVVPPRPAAPYQGAIPCAQAAVVSGTVASNPVRNAAGTHYTVQVAVSSVSARYGRARLASSASGLLSVRLPAALVEAVYPGRLYSRSPDGALLVETGERLTCTGSWSARLGAFAVDSAVHEGHSGGLAGTVRHVRALSRLAFKRLLYSWGAAGGLVLSLFSGSREYTEAATGEAFRAAGLSHVLALSGMHLSFFSGLAGNAARRLFGKRHMLLPRLAGMLLFVWFAGLSPSLFRALLCALIALAAPLLSCGKAGMLEVLSASFLIHAAVRPGDLLSAAFLLSYGALLGIILLSGTLCRLLSPAVPPFLAGALASSVGAQVATAPLTAALFGTIMPVGIVASVVIAPLISVFLTLALVAISLSLALPFLSPLFGAILNAVYALICLLVRLFAAVPPITF